MGFEICQLILQRVKQRTGHTKLQFLDTYPFGFLSSSFRSVWSQYSKTKCIFLFLLNTSMRFTRFGCFNCCKEIEMQSKCLSSKCLSRLYHFKNTRSFLSFVWISCAKFYYNFSQEKLLWERIMETQKVKRN